MKYVQVRLPLLLEAALSTSLSDTVAESRDDAAEEDETTKSAAITTTTRQHIAENCMSPHTRPHDCDRTTAAGVLIDVAAPLLPLMGGKCATSPCHACPPPVTGAAHRSDYRRNSGLTPTSLASKTRRLRCITNDSRRCIVFRRVTRMCFFVCC